jgi:eukaryotic-like serine/threonine-protein kinase
MSEPTHEQPTHPHDDDATSATAEGDDDLLAELVDDFSARARSGGHPSVEEYVARHPAFAERIRKVLSAVSMIEQGRATELAPPGEGPGSSIGRYKLLERIGEGGFGVVYMAEQVAPVRRKVALKVIKPGMDSRQVLARFEAERQALAIMDHENIAKVFDGGMTESGRPYFVMELVKGAPITEYCDANQLAPRQRLELFLQVCRAVQHAHQKGIIHRDIKPTNVLVVMHDTKPVVKVIDFGVAKALGQELTERTLFTGFAQLIGTPLYMSPEQAGQSGLDVDTRSDIYSLGVLLYELLTGTTPFDKERFRRAAQDEIRRIIREGSSARRSRPSRAHG